MFRGVPRPNEQQIINRSPDCCEGADYLPPNSAVSGRDFNTQRNEIKNDTDSAQGKTNNPPAVGPDLSEGLLSAIARSNRVHDEWLRQDRS